MLFPNWTGWKWAKLALAGVAGAASAVAASSDATSSIVQYAHDICIVDALILGFVVTLSGTSLGPAVARKS